MVPRRFARLQIVVMRTAIRGNGVPVGTDDGERGIPNSKSGWFVVPIIGSFLSQIIKGQRLFLQVSSRRSSSLASGSQFSGPITMYALVSLSSWEGDAPIFYLEVSATSTEPTKFGQIIRWS